MSTLEELNKPKTPRADGRGESTAGEQWYRSLFTRTTSASVRLDVSGRVIECNAAFPGLTGRSELDVQDHGLSVLFTPERWRLVEAGLDPEAAEDGFVVETSISHVDGHEIAVMVGVTPATVDEALAGHFVIIRNMTGQKRAMDALQLTMQQLRDARDNLERQVDARTQELKRANAALLRHISERQRVEEAVRWQAYHDNLTRLPNRMMFRQRVGEAIDAADQTGHRLGILFVDLDRFKNINDTLGHAIGDELLKEVSERFQSCLDGTMLLARMGGDEFTVLIPNVDEPARLKEIGLRLLSQLERPFLLSGHEVFVGGSVGVSVFPEDGRDYESLLHHADAAMYTVKGVGGGGIQRYALAMDSKLEDRLALETALRRGLERDEIVLHYQPQVDLRTGAVVGVEALVRWNHPELGLLPPAKFIPIAEETGLILRLGDLVMAQACRQARLWEEQGNAVHVAVNVFARQFEQSGLAARVSGILADTGLSPNLLELELTESALIRNCDSVRATVESLLAIGVDCSLDDFGTGYSSLSYLRRLPIKMLKIDQSFVNALFETADQPPDRLIMPNRLDDISTEAAIIRAVIDVAHALRLRTVAEGVETEYQRQILRDLGCDLMQGFLYSKPLPAAELEELIGIRQPGLSRAA